MSEVSYEKSDANSRAIIRAGIVLALATLATSAIVLFLFRWLAERAQREDAPPPPLARMEPGREPPAPRLQTVPARDLATVRAEDERTLTSYGWVDEPAGIVRIPVREAMRILAERGEAPLPRAAASPAVSRSPSPVPPARSHP